MPHFLNALEALTSSPIPIRNLLQGLEFDSEEAALIDVNKQQKAFSPQNTTRTDFSFGVCCSNILAPKL